MTVDDISFISTTEKLRSASYYFIGLSLGALIYHEFQLTTFYSDDVVSGTSSIVFALLAIAFRLIAMDRFFRMARQMDYESKHPDIG